MTKFIKAINLFHRFLFPFITFLNQAVQYQSFHSQNFQAEVPNIINLILSCFDENLKLINLKLLHGLLSHKDLRNHTRIDICVTFEVFDALRVNEHNQCFCFGTLKPL